MPRKSTEERKQEIKQAILEIIFEEGLMALTTRNLSRRVGLTEGALFRHFSSKRDMLLAIMEDVERELLERMKDIASSEAPAAQRLSTILCAQVEYLTQNRGIALLLFSEAAHLRDPVLKRKMHGILTGIRRELLRVLEDGVARGEWSQEIPVEDVANLYMGIPLMLNVEMILNPEADRMDFAKLCFGMHRLILRILAGAHGDGAEARLSETIAEELLEKFAQAIRKDERQ